MARAAVLAAIMVVLAFAATVPSVRANAQLCNPGLTPATPTNVRVKSNIWNGKSAGEFFFGVWAEVVEAERSLTTPAPGPTARRRARARASRFVEPARPRMRLDPGVLALSLWPNRG
jgi:hypothetical protein